MSIGFWIPIYRSVDRETFLHATAKILLQELDGKPACMPLRVARLDSDGEEAIPMVFGTGRDVVGIVQADGSGVTVGWNSDRPPSDQMYSVMTYANRMRDGIKLAVALSLALARLTDAKIDATDFGAAFGLQAEDGLKALYRSGAFET